MTDQNTPSEKTFQEWGRLRVTNPILLAQELAKLKPQSTEEYNFLSSLLQGHGLKELLQALASEQELR